MQTYTQQRIIDEISDSKLFSIESKQALQDYISQFDKPEDEPTMSEFLHALIEARTKQEVIDAQTFSAIRAELEPLIVQIKDDNTLDEEVKYTLVYDITKMLEQYREKFIKQ